jgi:hypothetical protein
VPRIEGLGECAVARQPTLQVGCSPTVNKAHLDKATQTRDEGRSENARSISMTPSPEDFRSLKGHLLKRELS